VSVERGNAGGDYYIRLTTHILLPAYAPNAAVAQLVMPIILGTLVSFSGVLVPYAAITPFWRYWLYYINVSFLVASQRDAGR
jgi:hypothetical protein